MKRSSLKSWLAFGLVIVAAAAGLAWLSATLLRFEEASRALEERERLSARLRLAVWRVDSLLSPVLSAEAARPPEQYKPFYPLYRSYLAGGGSNASGEVLVPSPLLKKPGEWAVLNFEVREDGAMSSPQAPSGKQVAQAAENGLGSAEVASNARALADLKGRVDAAALSKRLEAALLPFEKRPDAGQFFVNDPQVAAMNSPPPQQQFPWPQSAGQQAANQQEAIDDLQARTRAANRQVAQQKAVNPAWAAEGQVAVTRVSRLVPLWIEADKPTLLFVRRVEEGGRARLQGVVADWEKLKAMAEEEVKDLFPGASLKPVPPAAVPDPDRVLAVLPAELDPGEVPPAEAEAVTPARAGLAALWLAFFSGALVTGAGLKRLLDLNRRRLDFVSAVTHELRTPLTTFRMYAEMLEEGMVAPEKLPEYYATLRDESLRLSHLVQNVLDYSRLEADRAKFRLDSASAAEHLARLVPPLEERCASKGVPFTLSAAGTEGVELSLDSAGVGQILFNLVDNACKYGDGAVSLAVSVSGGRVAFEVSDEGPGVPGAERARIFEPFVRGSTSEGRGAGVGLGLALCRRWARALGGDLALGGRKPSSFTLSLPGRP